MSGGELVGDPKLKITGAASLAEATSGEISFFANRKYIGLLRKTRASAVFVPPDFTEPLAAAQVRVSNPTKAFEQVVLKNGAIAIIDYAHTPDALKNVLETITSIKGQSARRNLRN